MKTVSTSILESTHLRSPSWPPPACFCRSVSSACLHTHTPVHCQHASLPLRRNPPSDGRELTLLGSIRLSALKSLSSHRRKAWWTQPSDQIKVLQSFTSGEEALTVLQGVGAGDCHPYGRRWVELHLRAGAQTLKPHTSGRCQRLCSSADCCEVTA